MSYMKLYYEDTEEMDELKQMFKKMMGEIEQFKKGMTEQEEKIEKQRPTKLYINPRQ